MELFKDPYGILKLAAIRKQVSIDDEDLLEETFFWDTLEVTLQKAQPTVTTQWRRFK